MAMTKAKYIGPKSNGPLLNKQYRSLYSVYDNKETTFRSQMARERLERTLVGLHVRMSLALSSKRNSMDRTSLHHWPSLPCMILI